MTEEIEVYLGKPHPRTDKYGDDPFAGSAKDIKSLMGIKGSLKRKINTKLEKAYTGEGDAKSKREEWGEITGYDAFEVVQPLYNLDYLAALFEVSSAHYAAVKAKTANIVGLGFTLVESPKSKRKLEAVSGDQVALDFLRRKISRFRDMISDHLDNLNDEDTFIETLSKAWIDYETTGNGYIEIGRTTAGVIGYIGHIPSTTMRVRRMRDGFVQLISNKAVFFRNFQGDAPNPIGSDPNPNEIIHLKKYTPTNGYYGIPDIVPAKAALAGNDLAANYNIDYFENKAVPRYVIILKGATLSDAAQINIQEFFETGLKSKNHRSLYIPLPPDSDTNKVEFKMEPVEAGVQESSFEKYKASNTAEILMAHRVPISKVSAASGISLANARDADKTFKETVCLAGETLVMTPDGDIAIKDLVGSITRLLTMDKSGTSSVRWVDAPIKSFGKQHLSKVTLSRHGITKDVYATAEHRWFVRKTLRKFEECTTENLTPGNFLQSVYSRSSASRIKNLNAGVPHGIVFGDGNLNKERHDAQISLFGEKNKVLLDYFPQGTYKTYSYDRNSEPYIAVTGLSRTWKALPALDESDAYLYGFLAGWFAADGSVRGNGSAQLYNAHRDNLEYAKLIARRIGIDSFEIVEESSGGNIVNDRYIEKVPLFSLTFIKNDLDESFFLIPEHRERWALNRSLRKVDDWKVVSVEKTSRYEEVFCAVVEGTGNFALADNLLTGNCQPEQDVLEKKVNRVIAEMTDGLLLKFNEMSLTDAITQAGIDQIYLRNDSVTPNEVRAAQGQPGLPDGDETVGLMSQAKLTAKVAVQNAKLTADTAKQTAAVRGAVPSQNAANQKAVANQSRTRDATRSVNQSDKQGTGRSAQGDGRRAQ